MRLVKTLAVGLGCLALQNVAQAQSGGVLSRPGTVPSAGNVGDGPRAKYEPAGDRVYHGAGLPNFWDENGLRAQVQQYQKLAGKRLSVITWFASTYEMGRMTSWAQNYAGNLQRVKRAGALSLIKFSMQDSAFDKTRKIAKTSDVARGVYDAYFEEFADTIKAFGEPVFISMNHEMNGNWYPFSQDYPGSGVTAADFIASWRHVVDIFRARGADNVAWVWSPNVPDVGTVPFTKYYPGDSYTDWIGVSFYSGNPMSNLRQIYSMFASKKPIFITEWATAPEKSQYYQGYPGDAKWVSMVFDALEKNYPRVKAISWFQWDKKYEDGNYVLQRDAAQAQVYNANVQAQRYLDKPAIAAAAGTTSNIESVPVQAVPKEVVLEERPAVVNPKPQAAPLPALKLQIVKTEKVRVER